MSSSSPRSTRARRPRAASCSTARRGSCPSARSSTSSSIRGPGTSSTTRSASGATCSSWSRTRSRPPQLSVRDLAGLGITNQRETTVLWDRATGAPVHNAITWQDTRTDQLVRELGGTEGVDRYRDRCGLPLATYFSAPKIRWLLDHEPGLRERAEAGDVLFGTMDSWLIWNLTGRHLTDVTNAGRTMLMNLDTLDWDDVLLDAMGVPRAMLPEIRPSTEIYGEAPRRARGPAGRGGARRPARRPVRPALPRVRRRQVHLRHRQLPARQHRPGAGPLAPTGCWRRSATSSATSPRPTRSRARSPPPGRSCSGCATASA